MKRYEMTTEYNSVGCYDEVIPVESADGDWIKFADYQAASEAAKATGTAGEQDALREQWARVDAEIGGKAMHVAAFDDGVNVAEAARQPAPVAAQENGGLVRAALIDIMEIEQAATAGEFKQDMTFDFAKQSHYRALFARARAALAATAAPVLQPHYRMSEKPTAWLHTLPEGKFFNGAFSDNSQIIRNKDEADSECHFHGGTLTPLFTAEWTQAGLDYVNEKADELHKKIIGSQP